MFAEPSVDKYIDIRLTASAVRLRGVLKQPPPYLFVTRRNDMDPCKGQRPLSPYTVAFGGWMLRSWLHIPLLTAALS